jgi:hypothetical protein
MDFDYFPQRRGNMTERNRTEHLIRQRMHGLYLSRKCEDIVTLAHELMGLHSWFFRNVCFSALIRGADIRGWKTALTKTWLYRGTLHGVAFEDLPQLLALHTSDSYLFRFYGKETVEEFAQEVLRYMEDGVFSRTEFRRIFADEHDAQFIDAMFSPWGGIFVYLARQGRVAFRDMASRDFDLIDAEPTQTFDEVLPSLLRRFFVVYGPATLADAAWFFGFWKDDAKKLRVMPLDDCSCFELDGNRYYSCGEEEDIGDIPKLTLLSGFDPLLVSYTERSAVLPAEYKSKVILKSGICNPTVLVDGRVAGVWNIKNNQPIVEFFATQPKKISAAALEMVDSIRWRSR